MTSRTIFVAVALALGLAVGGCVETERPLSYEKGVYGGRADQPLSQEQLDALRQRGDYQNS